MKFPFLTRKQHNQEIEKTEERYRRREARLKNEHEREIDSLTKDVQDVVKRLTDNTIYHDHEQNDWRIVTSLPPDMMARALERGNDEIMIDIIGESVKRHVVDKLIVCNIQRSGTKRNRRG